MNGLDAKERLFVLEFLKDFNGAQAATRAGYSAKRGRKTAYDLMQRPRVREAVAKEFKKMCKKAEVDAQYVINNIVETIERCKQERPMLDKQGNPIMVEGPFGQEMAGYEFDPGAVLKGCELLGKHLKMFTDKVEHTGTVGVTLIDEFLE